MATELILHAFTRMLEASWQAAGIALVVLLVQAVLGRRLPARWRCALWVLVFVRLVLPALPPSPTSVMNLSGGGTAPSVLQADADREVVTFGVIGGDGATSFAPVLRGLSVETLSPRDSSVLLTAARIWLAIAAALVLRTLVRCFLLARRLRKAATTTDRRLLAAVAAARQQAGVGAPVRVVETSLVASPAIAGILRPTLLFPPGLAQGLDDNDLRFVLLHELAHHRRRDVLAGLIATLIASVHWFNPFAWFAAARYAADRELACDESVLALTGENPSYGRTILKLLERFPPRGRATAGAAAMLGGRRAVRRRIAAIAAAPAGQWPAVGAILVLAIGCAALTGRREDADANQTAPPAATEPADPPGTVTRAYDIRDLLIQVPDFDDAPELGIPIHPTTRAATASSPARDAVPVPATVATSTAPSQENQKTRAALVQDLIVRITSTVDPLSWKSNTGTLGSVRTNDAQLIITQTPENHERIQRLLADLRGPRSVQVTVETRFLSSSTSADAALKRWGERWRPVEGSKFQMWPRFLDDAQAAELIRATQRDRTASTVTAPRITLFSGQRAYVLVARDTAYVGDFRRVGNDESDKSFDPVIDLIQSGVLVDCRAQVSPDQTFATLTLAPQMVTLVDLLPQRWPGSTPAHDRMIQVPIVKKAVLKTTVTMPDGKTALYRLPEVLQVETSPGKVKPMERNMLLLVRPKIIVQREVESPQPASMSSTTKPSTAP